MTTTTEGKVDLAASGSNGQPAPKRRGRPPGSKNKPKTGDAPAKPARTRRVAAAAPLPTFTANKAVHAVLLENTGVSFLYTDGTTSAVDAPVFDRRTK